jgi:hypothetical protein
MSDILEGDMNIKTSVIKLICLKFYHFNLGHCNSKGDIWNHYGSISFDNHSHDILLNFVLKYN